MIEYLSSLAGGLLFGYDTGVVASAALFIDIQDSDLTRLVCCADAARLDCRTVEVCTEVKLRYPTGAG